MAYLRLAFRLPTVGLHVMMAALLAPLLLPANSEAGFSPFQKRVVRWLMGRCLRLLGVRVRVCGQPDDDAKLLVSNHISWLDILVIGSLRPSCFLSKAEIRHWPLFGRMAPRFGTIFIERGRGSDSARDAIAARLERGTEVTLFPEGTTTDGTSVKNFYPRLLACAIDTGVKVQPVALCYPWRGGVNPHAPFTRNDSLFRHGLPLIQMRRIEAVVSFGEPIDPHQLDRRTLAERARNIILAEVEKCGAPGGE